MNRWVPVLAVCALTAPVELVGQDTHLNRATLENLGGVFIRLEVGEACEAAGVTAADHEAAISLHLIEAEVGVLTREEMLRSAALSELRVTLDCASSGPADATAYSVELRVQQAAQMLRDTQVTLPEAVTWYSTELGVAPASDVSAALETALSEQLAIFVAAWSEANGDEGGGRG